MKPSILCLGIVGIWLGMCGPAGACIWDRFTVAEEKSPFPKSHDLITGRFLRHSAEFYAWRRDDRVAKLQKKISPESYDDLGVSYDKLGEHAKAVETMLQKEAKFPGKYETYANLGTFYIHGGEIERGVGYLERAIRINPDAHFGREIYQILLCKYVLRRRAECGEGLPLSVAAQTGPEAAGFARFVLEEIGTLRKSADDKEELARAQKGIEGMMRFGHYESPVLLEALGDLMLASGRAEWRELAARAYLKASYECAGEARAAYRHKAGGALPGAGQDGGGETREERLRGIEAAFRVEIEKGAKKFEKVRADEMGWIAAGKDPELETLRKYYPDPEISASLIDLYPPLRTYLGYAVMAAMGLAGMIVLVVFGRIVRRMKGP